MYPYMTKTVIESQGTFTLSKFTDYIDNTKHARIFISQRNLGSLTRQQ